MKTCPLDKNQGGRYALKGKIGKRNGMTSIVNSKAERNDGDFVHRLHSAMLNAKLRFAY